MAVPVKPEYGPTLGELLAPRWRAASPRARRAVVVAGVLLAAAIVAAVLTLENASYSHGGSVPFGFSYRGLYRVAPDPGGYVKIQRRGADGRLEDSFAVDPLRLAPYSGSLSGELPLYASGYIRTLSKSDRDFVLRGEGKTKVNGIPTAYDVFYTTVVEGRMMFGRNFLLLPERPGVRQGVDIVILQLPGPGVTSPSEVATGGTLVRPLKSFSFG